MAFLNQTIKNDRWTVLIIIANMIVREAGVSAKSGYATMGELWFDNNNSIWKYYEIKYTVNMWKMLLLHMNDILYTNFPYLGKLRLWATKFFCGPLNLVVAGANMAP